MQMPRRIKGDVPNGFDTRLASLRKQAGMGLSALAHESG
jgi:hypothetical protein